MTTLSAILDEDDYVQEGVNPAPGVLVLACTVGDDYDEPDNRILVLRDGTWFDFNVGGDVLMSVDGTPDGTAFVLGENGSVIQLDWRTPATSSEMEATSRRFDNPQARLGPLRTIRVMGGEVVCSGTRGQAYRLRDGNFDALPRLVINDQEQTLESICGSSASDFIAVTTDGFGAHFDGAVWHNLDLPTNVPFNAVCRLPQGGFAIVGDAATLIIGQPGQWRLVRPDEAEYTFWGVAARESEIFVGNVGGIEVFDGSSFRLLDIPQEEDDEFGLLRQGPDGIWSFNGHTIGVITSAGWQRLP